MKIHKPRHPIVIIGAGIAGLSAAVTLREMGIPCVILERFFKPGGRLNSRRGDGWIADHGCRYIRPTDHVMGDLIRKAGMEGNRVTIQGPIYKLGADNRIIIPADRGLAERLAIDIGFTELADRLAAMFPVRYQTPVNAIRWDNDRRVFWWDKEGQVFWFEQEGGEPLRHRTTREVLLASGVILATTPTAASRIAHMSRSLESIQPLLSSVETIPTFTGLYRIPRQKVGFYALEGTPESRIRWISFEEKKASERIDNRHSLLLVDANPEWSDELITTADDVAMGALYAAARDVIPGLPEMPVSQTLKRWRVARVTSQPLGIPMEDDMPRWPVNPPHAPFALAGDYLTGTRAEDAARSGVQAARMVAARLPEHKSFLGLNIQ